MSSQRIGTLNGTPAKCAGRNHRQLPPVGMPPRGRENRGIRAPQAGQLVFDTSNTPPNNLAGQGSAHRGGAGHHRAISYLRSGQAAAQVLLFTGKEPPTSDAKAVSRAVAGDQQRDGEKDTRKTPGAHLSLGPPRSGQTPGRRPAGGGRWDGRSIDADADWKRGPDATSARFSRKREAGFSPGRPTCWRTCPKRNVWVIATVAEHPARREPRTFYSRGVSIWLLRMSILSAVESRNTSTSRSPAFPDQRCRQERGRRCCGQPSRSTRRLCPI